MALSFCPKEPVAVASSTLPVNRMSSGRWTTDQLKLAFHLYCQLPFGKLHSRNSSIIELAALIGRTPSAVAMKLVNFASLDPAITSSGRSGLGNASALDRQIWADFHADWEGLAVECERLRQQLGLAPEIDFPPETETSDFAVPEDFTGETRRALSEQRIKQNFFRRAVLASYRGRCCMSGLSEPRLLIASHIVPWSKDKANRLNPANGLCLSAIHDRAFDQGLLALTDDFRVLVSPALTRRGEAFVEQVFLPLAGHSIEFPERFTPNVDFVRQHRESLYIPA